MISSYVKNQIDNNSDKFEYTDYRHTIADLRKLKRDADYARKSDYIVVTSKKPPIIGLKALKKTEERKSKLETLSMINEAEDLMREARKNKK